MSNTLIVYETNEVNVLYVVPQDKEIETLEQLRKVAGKYVNTLDCSNEDAETIISIFCGGESGTVDKFNEYLVIEPAFSANISEVIRTGFLY